MREREREKKAKDGDRRHSSLALHPLPSSLLSLA
jgi:hypothetical protein